MPRRVISLRRAGPRISSPASRTLPLRRHQAGDGVAQRGLAHAVAADDAEHAALEREAHALQRVGAAVVDVEALDDQHRAARLSARRDRVPNQAISACPPCRSPAPARRSRSRPGVPVRSTRPLCITVTRSTTRSAMSRSCSISTKLMCAGSERQQRHQFAPLGRRQAGGRLVEQDQPRRAGQRHADLQLALLAVRQVGDALVGDVGQARALEQVVGGRASTRGRARARRKLKRPLATPRTARNRLSRTVRSRNSSDDW